MAKPFMDAANVARADELDVSLIVPLYGPAELLLGLLKSILLQTRMPTVELLLVEAGPFDWELLQESFAELLTALKASGVEVRWVRSPAPLATSTAMDAPRPTDSVSWSEAGSERSRPLAWYRGVQSAQADWVCILEPDCQISPDYLAVGVDRCQSAGRVGMIFSRVYPRFQEPPRACVYSWSHLFGANSRWGDRPRCWPGQATWTPVVASGMWLDRDLVQQLLAEPVEAAQKARAAASEQNFSAANTPLQAEVGATSLPVGAELEWSYRIGQAGYERSYEPALAVHRIIPPKGNTLQHLMQRLEVQVRSELTLRLLYENRARAWQSETANTNSDEAVDHPTTIAAMNINSGSYKSSKIERIFRWRGERWQALLSILFVPLIMIHIDPWGELLIYWKLQRARWQGSYPLPTTPPSQPLQTTAVDNLQP